MMFRNEFPAVLFFIFLALSVNEIFGLTTGQTRSKKNSEDLLPFTSEEEEDCSLIDSCTVDNVTSSTVTVRWPCCAGKTFILLSKPLKFSRYKTSNTCSCSGPDRFKENDTGTWLTTSNCSATLSNYCPYGDYQLNIRSAEESCTLKLTTLPTVPQWTERRAIAEDKILLSWKNTYCTNFKQPIYRISWTDPDLVETEDERTETTMTITFLAPNTKYLIKLRACDNHDNSNNNKFCSKNTTVEVRTKPAAPSSPRDVKVVKRTSEELLLKWKRPSTPRGQINGYVIKVLDDETEDILQGKALHHRLANLSPETNYTIAIFAFNMDGNKRLEGEQVIVNITTKSVELTTAEAIDRFQTSFKEACDSFKNSFDSFKEDTKLELSRISTILNQTFQPLVTVHRQGDLATGPCLYPPCS